MMRYYTSTVAPEKADELAPCDNFFGEKALALKNALTRAGLLQNVMLYGNHVYSWQVGQTAVHPITVQMEDEKLVMHIASSGTGASEAAHDIVQYCYTSGEENALNGKDMGYDYIQSTITTWKDTAWDKLSGYGVDKLVQGIGLLCPEAAVATKGSAAAVKFLGSILETDEKNRKAQDASDAMTVTDAMSAFGLRGISDKLCGI